MSILSKNLKLLRKESYLSLEEIAEKAGASEEKILEWEEGVSEPNDIILEKLCVVLRMPFEDIRERDLTLERQEAVSQMKGKQTRTNYDWYFGSKKEKLFHLGYILYFIIGLTVAILVCDVLQTRFGDYSMMQEYYPEYTLEYIKMMLYLNDLYKCLLVFIVGCGIFMGIWFFKRRTIPIYWWYIWFLSLIITVEMIVCAIGCIPFFVYSIIKLFPKKQK